MEKDPLVTELEKLFTIDGRGTSKKCKRFLELLESEGQEKILEEVRKMSLRKF
jgi:hypothetical protein